MFIRMMFWLWRKLHPASAQRWLGSALHELFEVEGDHKLAVFDADKLVAALQEMDHDNRTVWTVETDEHGRGVALSPHSSLSHDQGDGPAVGSGRAVEDV